MDIPCIGQDSEIDWDLLSARFPDISFFLSVLQEDSLDFCQTCDRLYSNDIVREIQGWKASLALEDVSILYVYGIGMGYHYEILKEWLQEKRERLLVFFEEDLRVLELFFRQPLGKELLHNAQVQICYVPEGSEWDLVLDGCVQRWISDKVEFTAIASYSAGRQKKISKLRWSLLRKSSLVHVGMSELLHYPLLLENIVTNFCYIPGGFHVNQMKDSCQGIPAIICGAGASLSDEISHLQEIGGKAILIAGGSAITALGYQGITPHIAIALDPNEEEYERLKGSSAFESLFVYSSRLHKEVLSSTNVRSGYLCSDTGGIFETWMHEQLQIEPGSLGPELGMEALSVTTLAVPLARHLGCNPILFCGVDLSYRDKQRYSPGVLPSSQINLKESKQETRALERLVRKKGLNGKSLYTLVKWVMEASCMGAYVKKQQQIDFFNASATGLPIPHVSFLSVQEFVERYGKQERDLLGLLHAETERTKFPATTAALLPQTFKIMIDSLKRSLTLVEEILGEIEKKNAHVEDLLVPVESGRMSLLEMDLYQEPAYKACLQYPFSAYGKVLERIYPSWHSLETIEGRRCFLSRKKDLWQECKKAIFSCLDALKNKERKE